MAHDYEDTSSIDDLDDDELQQLIKDRLDEHPGITGDDINVAVNNGAVRLTGSIGTESEMRIAEHIITDAIGVTDVENLLVVDGTRRLQTSEDIDEVVADEEASAGTLLGEIPEQDSPEVDLNRGDEDLDERLYGTTNSQDAIAHGTSYNPPEFPTPEGDVG